MEIRKDILGKTPKIGDTAAWNPVDSKGLVYGTIVDFRKQSGLPMIRLNDSFPDSYYGTWAGECNVYVPKTGFVII